MFMYDMGVRGWGGGGLLKFCLGDNYDPFVEF